jgi:hypothetical protein
MKGHKLQPFGNMLRGNIFGRRTKEMSKNVRQQGGSSEIMIDWYCSVGGKTSME